MTPNAKDPRAVLEERARRLAQPFDADALTGSGVGRASSLLIFRLGDERAGIALDHVVEVHRPLKLTPIPGASPPVVGVVPWRGRVLTILDVAHGRRGAIAIGESTRILVMGHRRASFGIIADDVEDMQEVHPREIGPVDDVESARRDIVRGVTSDALVIIDAAALVARFATPN